MQWHAIQVAIPVATAVAAPLLQQQLHQQQQLQLLAMQCLQHQSLTQVLI